MRKLCLILTCLIIPSLAQAQSFLGQGGASTSAATTSGSAINQYNSKYKGDPDAASQTGLIPQSGYDMHFVRAADPQDIILRLSSPLTINGCATISSPSAEQRIKGQNLWVTITPPTIAPDTSVRDAHFGCASGGGAPAIDIILNRKQLKDQNIKQLILKSNNITQYLNLKITQHRLMITPKRSAIQNTTDNTPLATAKPLIHWFYPDNMIILSTPGAPAKTDIKSQVRRLAYSQGLIEARHALPGFTPPGQTQDKFYFVDQTKKLAKILGAGKAKTIGTIQIGEQFMGTNGPYMRPLALDVFASLPGAYD